MAGRRLRSDPRPLGFLTASESRTAAPAIETGEFEISLFTDREYPTATIAAGTALSGAVALGPKTIVGIFMPAAWTAADLTFQSSRDGGTTWQELEVTDLAAADAVAAAQVHSPAASQFIGLDPTKLEGIGMLKIRSGTSGTPVNQVAQAVLTLVTRGMM